jgi:hypothetical protein
MTVAINGEIRSLCDICHSAADDAAAKSPASRMIQ